MKKLLLLLLFLQLLQAKSQTSVYRPFPDSNAVWNFHYSVQCPIGTLPSPNADYSIIINGDTNINNITYRKLYTPFILVNYNANNCPMPDSGYQGAIREDTILKRVYMITKYGTIEKLYFDFNWKSGDTISGILGNSFQDTIVTVDSVLVGNTYRKRWLINSWYQTYVIEGIGSTYGLLSNAEYATDQPYYNLTCFKQDNQILYPDTATVCEKVTVSINEPKDLTELKIFPNPGKDHFYINIKDLKIKEVFIYDIYGKLMSKTPVEKNGKITTEELPEGIYFLSASDKEANIFYSKIFIQR